MPHQKTRALKASEKRLAKSIQKLFISIKPRLLPECGPKEGLTGMSCHQQDYYISPVIGGFVLSQEFVIPFRCQGSICFRLRVMIVVGGT